MYHALEEDVFEEKNAYIKNRCFSIHTFEMKISLDKEEWRYYKRLLDSFCIKRNDRTGYRNRHYYYCIKNSSGIQYASCFHCYDNEELFQRGISDICFVEKKVTGDAYASRTVSASVRFQVNPRILLGYAENKYVCIAPGGELCSIIPGMAEILKAYGFEERDFERAVIKRLDLCTNIGLGNQMLAEKYLKLLRKGGIYRGLNVKEMPLDPVSHRHMHPRNEVRYTSRLSLHGKGAREKLSIYLKHAQMQENREKCGYCEEEIRHAEGRVRFELRIGCSKLGYLKKKYKCGHSADLVTMAGIMGTDMFMKYLEGLYGSGKFIKTGKALEVIEQSCTHRKDVKDTMADIVKQTRKTDMADAFGQLPVEGKYHYRNYFNGLGISPVTFPDSWKEEIFENPLTYILTNNVNEC